MRTFTHDDIAMHIVRSIDVHEAHSGMGTLCGWAYPNYPHLHVPKSHVISKTYQNLLQAQQG